MGIEPLLSLRRDSPPGSSPTFSVRPRSSVGRVTVDLIRRSWVRFPPRSKIFSLPHVVTWFPLLGLTPSGLFMGSISTLIYTSELIVCFTICVLSATRHNIHMYPYLLYDWTGITICKLNAWHFKTVTEFHQHWDISIFYLWKNIPTGPVSEVVFHRRCADKKWNVAFIHAPLNKTKKDCLDMSCLTLQKKLSTFIAVVKTKEVDGSDVSGPRSRQRMKQRPNNVLRVRPNLNAE